MQSSATDADRKRKADAANLKAKQAAQKAKQDKKKGGAFGKKR